MTQGEGKASDYTIDLAYPSAFGAFQAPVHLAYVAALGGRRAADCDARFAYCDLGTGAGLTLCVLADCYPHAEFHGVDINPGHVASARDLAQRAGLTNVTFHHASFAELGGLGLPPCDFVALSGVYSWLPPALRAAALGWARSTLTDRGVVYLHYGALPGNSQVDALYALIRETAAGIAGDSLTKFHAAVAQMRRLADANALFFRTNPYAKAWLDGLPQQDARSMAHEVLNAQPVSLSARDAADEAAAQDLAYVANAQIELNHMALVAPAALRADLENAAPIAREMMLDAIRNAHSRMDLIAPPGERADFVTAAGHMLLDRLSRGPLREERVKLSRSTRADFSAPVYDAVLAAVDGSAARLDTVIARLMGEGHARDAAIEAVQHCVATKLIHVLARPYAEAPGSSRAALASKLNHLLLEEQIESAGSLPLASRVAGTQVMLPPADRLALLALVGGDFDAAWQRVRKAGQRIKYQGRAVENARELAAVAAARADAVGASMIAHLGRLGIVEAA